MPALLACPYQARPALPSASRGEILKSQTKTNATPPPPTPQKKTTTVCQFFHLARQGEGAAKVPNGSLKTTWTIIWNKNECIGGLRLLDRSLIKWFGRNSYLRPFFIKKGGARAILKNSWALSNGSVEIVIYGPFSLKREELEPFWKNSWGPVWPFFH
jgi:hypothetical protein